MTDKYGFLFRDWDIYKDARQFRLDIMKLSRAFSLEEKYALTDQVNRALNSIILNIAESSNKNSDKDSRVYINRSHCSLDEVVSCLDNALDSNYISKDQHHESLEKAASLARRLRGFNNYLAK